MVGRFSPDYKLQSSELRLVASSYYYALRVVVFDDQTTDVSTDLIAPISDPERKLLQPL